ncbi:MAG: Flp family type IVb pilin [Acidobacteriota bacterium]
MTRLAAEFLRDEAGQDMVEYSLLLAFVVMASAALFMESGESIYTIWGVTSTYLSAGAAVS